MSVRFNTSIEASQVGQAIKAARRARGWTLPQLGKMSGVHPGQISRIERGVMKTGSSNVQVLCKILELDLQALIDSQEAVIKLASRLAAIVNRVPGGQEAVSRLIDALEAMARHESA